MHPILIEIANVPLYTYGLFVALGFLTALALAQKEARRLGEDPGPIADLGFYLLLAAIVGSRLFFLLVNPEVVLESPLAAFEIWKGGLVFYGGFIGALIIAILFVRKKKLSFMRVADIFSPGLAAGHAVGRIGCFFAGCCYGRECELPWAVVFKDPLSLAPTGVHLHPTQLYSVGANLIVFGILWFSRTRVKRQGRLFWLYVLLYGISRTILEFFRGDPRGFILGGPSVSQTIGIGLACVAAVVLIRTRNKTGNGTEPL